MDIKRENISYWNHRAESYSALNQAQLEDGRGKAWLAALEEPLRGAFPGNAGTCLRILDIGCGPGLFSILLAQRGHEVTAADYTPNMLREARANASAHRIDGRIRFVEADAQDLPFPDASFDAVVSRNLTWNLPYPRRAYAEWMRVLAPGGTIVNFDANWYRHLFDGEAQRAYEEDRMRTSAAGVEEACEIEGYRNMEAIAREVPLSPVERPTWDLRLLQEMGLDASADTLVWQRVWSADEQVNFASTPLFRIVARKPGECL